MSPARQRCTCNREVQHGQTQQWRDEREWREQLSRRQLAQREWTFELELWIAQRHQPVREQWRFLERARRVERTKCRELTQCRQLSRLGGLESFVERTQCGGRSFVVERTQRFRWIVRQLVSAWTQRRLGHRIPRPQPLISAVEATGG